MHYKVVYIVLHFLAQDMTEKCIRQLLGNNVSGTFRIVLVDNGSKNGSGARLKRMFKDNEEIDILLNEENSGFAKGNNIGFDFIKKNYECDFVICMNNDVLIKQKSFVEGIYRLYQNYGFDILGPDIFCPLTGEHQNPMKLNGYTLDEVANIIKTRSRWLKAYPLHYGFNLLRKRLAQFGIIRFLKKKQNIFREINGLYKDEHINPVLHGACLVFSKKYFVNRDEVFDSTTFLYLEEDILHFKSKIEGNLMIYTPEIQVIHLDDVSTVELCRSEYKLRKMKYRCLVESGKVLYDIMSNQK